MIGLLLGGLLREPPPVADPEEPAEAADVSAARNPPARPAGSSSPCLLVLLSLLTPPLEALEQLHDQVNHRGLLDQGAGYPIHATEQQLGAASA